MGLTLVLAIGLIVCGSHGFVTLDCRSKTSICDNGAQFTRADRRLQLRPLSAAAKDEDVEFWKQQRAVINEMNESSERAVRAEQKEKFAIRRGALVADTAYFGFFIFCILWSLSTNPFVAFSYGFGASLGLAYAYGLGKFVEGLGKTTIEAPEPGEGVGQARFAFLILLFIIVGKFRENGLLELPAISGFFTYQLGSLSQGFKDFDD